MNSYGKRFLIRDKKTGKLVMKKGKPISWQQRNAAVNFMQILNNIDSIEGNRFTIEYSVIDAKESVEYYLHSSHVYSIEPLIFIKGINQDTFYTPMENISIGTPVDDLVLQVLELARSNSSFRLSLPFDQIFDTNFKLINRKGYYSETFNGRSRSSLDIWRHIKYYLPEITLYDVMHSLYNIMQTHPIMSQYCNTIRRRVFNAQNSYNRPTNYSASVTDEYGLKFPDWKNV